MKQRTEYESYMDRLAQTIVQAIPDGAEIPDVISACAAVIGCALADVPVERRETMLAAALAFIEACCAKRVADAWCGGEQ